jgi:methylase of polypeptide subunit release factors
MIEYTIPNSQFVVSHNSQDDGGGTWFGQEYIDILTTRYQHRWNRCLEWCSGPGFIGFAILAHDLCDQLVLQDTHAAVENGIVQTLHQNNCKNKVTFYSGNSIQCIPAQQFDLIVANPPHYLECPGNDNYQRLAVDCDWAAHRDFYQHVGRYLAPDGMILMQENRAGSLGGVSDFWNMIHSNGLQITAYWSSQEFWNTQGPAQIYYIEIKHQQ